MFGKWHLLMPVLTLLYGYFPGKRLGWLEDTPAGVVRDWSMPTAQYETRPSGRVIISNAGGLPFASVTAKTLAISISANRHAERPSPRVGLPCCMEQINDDTFDLSTLYSHLH